MRRLGLDKVKVRVEKTPGMKGGGPFSCNCLFLLVSRPFSLEVKQMNGRDETTFFHLTKVSLYMSRQCLPRREISSFLSISPLFWWLVKLDVNSQPNPGLIYGTPSLVLFT